jgi:hypothetical protein
MTLDRRSTRQRLLSRREVLKALATIGGAAGAGMLLPERWTRPAVEAGVLPVHAQSSVICKPPYTIDHCQIYDIYRESATFLHYVSKVHSKPACAGVPMILEHEILDGNMEILYSSELHGFQDTNSDGEAMMIFSTGIGFEPEARWVTVTWRIAKSEYGTSVCTDIQPIPR